MFDKCFQLCLTNVFQLMHYKTEVSEMTFLHPKNPFLYFNNVQKFLVQTLLQVKMMIQNGHFLLTNLLICKRFRWTKISIFIKKRVKAGIKNLNN